VNACTGENAAVYCGTSAGAIIMGESMETACWKVKSSSCLEIRSVLWRVLTNTHCAMVIIRIVTRDGMTHQSFPEKRPMMIGTASRALDWQEMRLTFLTCKGNGSNSWTKNKRNSQRMMVPK
jgi:hypothetical protein